MRSDIIAGLAAAGAILSYLLWVLANPVTRCWRCTGRKVRKTVTGRRRSCRACKGTGHRPPPGARTVHAFYWSVFGDRIRDKRKADVSAQVSARKTPKGGK